jgi:imidazolonepropionase-like amidohydrolase
MWTSSLLFLLLSITGDTLVIDNVSVIDVIDGSVDADRTLIVTDGKIEKILPAEEVSPLAGAVNVDGQGKFVIPGLWDMHVHFASADYAPLFVANGVVGTRDMHAHLSFMLLPLRKATAEGKRLGPQIITAITMVDGGVPMWGGSLAAGDAEEGRKAVQTLKAKGADFVKVYSGLSPEAFHAICDEAAKNDLMVVGHVPEAVPIAEASAAGMRSMEHLFGILTAASRDAEQLRSEFVSTIQGVSGKAFYPLLIRAQLKALDTYSPERAAALYATLAKNQTYQCPTMTVQRMFANLTDPSFTSDERNRYTPSLIKMTWKQAVEWVLPIAENKADQQRLYFKSQEMVREMHRAGVPILAGTDTSNPYCFAGFSLHDELALLVEAGLSPLAALQAATLQPARFLKKESEFGSVAPGKRADLVLLDANPLEDIHNTTKIHAVVLGGKLYDRSSLDEMLTTAEKKAAGKP